jgi:hypothetical protein
MDSLGPIVNRLEEPNMRMPADLTVCRAIQLLVPLTRVYGDEAPRSQVPADYSASSPTRSGGQGGRTRAGPARAGRRSQPTGQDKERVVGEHDQGVFALSLQPQQHDGCNRDHRQVIASRCS